MNLWIYFEEWEMKWALFCQNYRKIHVVRSRLIFISILKRKKYPLQPWLMVAKDNSPFANVTDGCKETNYMWFSHEYGVLDTTSKRFSRKWKFYWKIQQNLPFFQPSVIVAKGKITFATMTHGCQTIIIDHFLSLLKIKTNQ